MEVKYTVHADSSNSVGKLDVLENALLEFTGVIKLTLYIKSQASDFPFPTDFYNIGFFVKLLLF